MLSQLNQREYFFIAPSQPNGLALLDGSLLFCIVQSFDHLPLSAHCPIYVKASVPPPPMTSTMKINATFAKMENHLHSAWCITGSQHYMLSSSREKLRTKLMKMYGGNLLTAL
jgi:hypothetical protein